MNEVLGIYGTGGSGRELEEMISSDNKVNSRWSEVVFIDDTQPSGTIRSRKRLTFDDFNIEYPEADIVIAVGEPHNREVLKNKVLEKGYTLATIICSDAKVSKYAVIGKGTVIKGNTVISSDAEIGDNVWIQSNAIVGHDVKIGDNCQISAFSFIGGRSIIHENVYIGVSASIREDTEVGANAIISMGAIVLKNVKENRIAMGNPAREIAENNDHKVFR